MESSLSPTHISPSHLKSPRCVLLLFSAGCSPDLARYDGATPLWIASAHHHAECVRLLLAAGADFTLTCDGVAPLGLTRPGYHSGSQGRTGSKAASPSKGSPSASGIPTAFAAANTAATAHHFLASINGTDPYGPTSWAEALLPPPNSSPLVAANSSLFNAALLRAEALGASPVRGYHLGTSPLPSMVTLARST